MKNNNKYEKGYFFKKVKNFFFNLSNIKIIFLTYLMVTLISSLLLLSPFSHKENVDVGYIDALFTAASAFSDTGLTTLITSETWSMFGQAVIAILILLGGIGIFALKVYVFNFIFGQALKMSTINILGKERSFKDNNLSKKTIIVSITLILFLVILSSFILSFIFYFEPPSNVGIEPSNNPVGDISLSIRFAIFHSISAINNAGFDIIGSSSLVPYYSVYSIQIIFMFLFIIGGIGYPVIYDSYSWIKHKIKKMPGKYSFSLFSKISCISYLIIAIMGLLLTFAFETTAMRSVAGDEVPLWQDTTKTTDSKIMAIFFNTFSTRNAGFATINLSELSQPTIVLYSIMMFIGSAPSSTAGGIRTTTIALVILSIWSKIMGAPSVRVFNRKIPKETTNTAGIVFSISILFVFIVSFITMSSIQNDSTQNFGYIDVIFEVSSAFGTTGLSTGLTPNLNIISKVVLILTMFIGQLGISSTILVWRSNKNKQFTFDYIEEDVAIG